MGFSIGAYDQPASSIAEPDSPDLLIAHRLNEAMSPEEQQWLTDEKAIIWLRDPSGFRYVRETTYAFCPSRSARPRFRERGPGREMIGYSMLRADVKPRPGCLGRFTRRVFWRKSYDELGKYLLGGCPIEAVDPASIFVGVAGKMTPRCAIRRLHVHEPGRATEGNA